MAVNMRNSLTLLIPDAACVIGELAVSGGTPSVSASTGTSIDQACLSVTDNGTGDYSIAVTNFRGAQGKLAGLATGTTISNMVSCTAASYTASTNTANFTFKVENDASTAVDSGFYFMLVAY